MVPIKAAKNPNDLKIMYTSTKRDNGDTKINPYSIFELGWPPSSTHFSPMETLLSWCSIFFGAGEIADLKVNFANNRIDYTLHPEVPLNRCP